MLIYVAARRRAGALLNYLQNEDLENTYICPTIAFANLRVDPNDLRELKLDLLSCSDKLIIVDEYSDELPFAHLVNMEVEAFEDGALRPISHGVGTLD